MGLLRVLFGRHELKPEVGRKEQAMFSRDFWIQTIERLVKSAAQGALLALGAGEGFDLFNVDWRVAGGFALGAAFLSLLTSVVSAPVSQRGTPSVVALDAPGIINLEAA